MKARTKNELAMAAGVSLATFRRWLKSDENYLKIHHVPPHCKVLPGKVVQYLCEKYDIELDR